MLPGKGQELLETKSCSGKPECFPILVDQIWLILVFLFGASWGIFVERLQGSCAE